MVEDPTAEALVLSLRDRSDAAQITAAVRAAQDLPKPRPAVIITLDTARLDGLLLQLGSVSAANRLDLRVQGAQAGTLLTNSRIALVGQDVSVSGLTFVGSPSNGDTLAVTVSGRADLSDLVFMDHRQRVAPTTKRRGARARGTALTLQAIGRDAVAVVDGVSFVDSTRTPSLAIGAQPRGRFAAVSLGHASFAAVALPAVSVGATLSLSLDDVLADLGSGKGEQSAGPSELIVTDSPAVVVDGDVGALLPDDERARKARAARPAPAP